MMMKYLVRRLLECTSNSRQPEGHTSTVGSLQIMTTKEGENVIAARLVLVVFAILYHRHSNPRRPLVRQAAKEKKVRNGKRKKKSKQ